MRQLVARTGIPTSTIKHYIRAGMMPPGRPTGANQAEYDDSHVERLQLIRVLTDIGRLPMSTIRRITEIFDAGGLPQLLLAPPVSLDQVNAAAAQLGVPFGKDVFDEYWHAAELIENAETGMCTKLDETRRLVAAVLGDAMIVAIRHELRAAR